MRRGYGDCWRDLAVLLYKETERVFRADAFGQMIFHASWCNVPVSWQVTG